MFHNAHAKVQELSNERLEDYYDNAVFKYGASQVTAAAYLSSQSMKCISRPDNENEVDGGFYSCGGTILPTMTISFMVTLSLVYKLAIEPLTKHTVTVREVRAFRGLSFKVKFQMLLLTLIISGNTYLFGQIKEAPALFYIRVLVSIVGVAELLVVFSELCSILFLQHRRRRLTMAAESEGGEEEGAARGKSSELFDNIVGRMV
mmetsp:Transcript_9131/g.18265  ORF Transcript_9131/g.18265 Transcript_9131/m.18265 type:complete len:204 (+) Transcript_9131:505-1116(+)